MSVQGLPTSYADVAYADSVLLPDEPWASASTPDKEEALQWGRIYIDTQYACDFDEDDPNDSVKTANSELGNKHLTTALFDSDVAAAENVRRGLTGEKVKAGSVESSKRFDAYASFSKVDRFPDVTAILEADVENSCRLKAAGVVSLVRR